MVKMNVRHLINWLRLIIYYPTLKDTREKLFDNEQCFGVVTFWGL